MSRIENALEKAALLRSEEKRIAPAGRLAIHSPTPPSPLSDVHLENPFLVTANARNTPIAEEYRKLKSVIVKLTQGGTLQNTLMVTSALSNEGKTITALNLAITLAQEYDHTVLLVDADLRKPSVHRYLGLEARPGLSECLSDNPAVSDTIIQTGIGKLSLLQAGKKVANPGEIFSSQRLKSLLHELKHRYPDRYVIIDTPPVLPFAETRSLSALVDGILFVVKEGVASANDINDSLGFLKQTPLLGIVYNEASIVANAGRYHYY